MTRFLVVAVFVCVLFVEYVQSNPAKTFLTPFSKKVKNKIPQDTYDEIFAVEVSGFDELTKALPKTVNAIEQVLGSKIDQSVVMDVADIAKEVGVDNIDSGVLFSTVVNAVGQTLKDNGKLNKNNRGKLAKKFVDMLNKAAKNLTSEDGLVVFPKLGATLAKFLKSQGVTDANQFGKNYLEEGKKLIKRDQ